MAALLKSCTIQPYGCILQPTTGAPHGSRYPLVNDIRSASRAMVRELGFMASTLAATPYSASAVHALLEIDTHGSVTAAQLAEFLGLDKSSVSRMVAKLIAHGELQEQPCADDARAKQLQLSAQGQGTVAGIHAYGQTQVRSALAQLNPSLQQAVAQGLTAYAQALQAHRLGSTAGQTSSATSATSSIQIHSGDRPGVIGRVAEMHAVFYARHWGFGLFLKARWPRALPNSAVAWASPATKSGRRCTTTASSAPSRLTGRIWATTRRICAGSFWMMAAAAAAWAASC